MGSRYQRFKISKVRTIDAYPITAAWPLHEQSPCFSALIRAPNWLAFAHWQLIIIIIIIIFLSSTFPFRFILILLLERRFASRRSLSILIFNSFASIMSLSAYLFKRLELAFPLFPPAGGGEAVSTSYKL